MTTYGFNLSLDEQEFWAIKEAMEFYLTSEAAELRKKNPHLVKYAAEINLRKMLSAGRLYQDVQLQSWNSFQQVTKPDFSISVDGMKSNLALEELLFDQLESESQLLSLAETPVCEQFINDPLVSQLMLDCILDGIQNANMRIRLECRELIENCEARNMLFRKVALKLYISLIKKL
jgi:hypothetical protein